MLVNSSYRRWLWSTSIACFVLGFCSMGVHRASSGIVYVELMTSNDVDREQASWPISVGAAFHSLSGIAGGVLLQFFSCRQVAVFGVLACTSGFVLCFLSQTIPIFILGYGVLTGAGVGLTMVSMHSYLNTEVKSQRVTVNGIFKSSASLAIVVLPYLIEWTIENYVFAGTMLLLAAMTLQSLVFSFLIQPFPKSVPIEIRNPVPKHEGKQDRAMSRSTSVSNTEVRASRSLSFFGIRHKNVKMNINGSQRSDLLKQRYSKTALQQNRSVESKTQSQDNVHAAQNSSTNTQSVMNYRLSSEDLTAFVEIPLTSIPEHQESDFQSQLHPSKKKVTKTELIFHRLLEVAANRMFHIVTLSHVAYLFLLLTYNVIILDFAMDRGMSRDKSLYLLSTYAVAELVGRVSCGWITDKGFLSRKQFLIVCDLLLVATLLIFTFCWNHGLMFCLSFVFGAVNGSAFAVIHVLYADYFRAELLSISMGLGQGFSVVAFLARPPVIGWFRDALGSYDYLFVVLAALVALAALAWILEPGRRILTRTRTGSSQVGGIPRDKPKISSVTRNG